MKSIFAALAFACLFTIAHAADPAADAKYDLKYKFKPGEVVRSEVVHRATVETTIQGSSQTANTRSASVKAWKVDEVKPDGTIKFTHLVESIDMWQQMQGRAEVRYNSATDKTPPPGYESVAQQVGVPLTTITMDPRGKILDRKEKIDQPNASPTQITIPLPTEPVAIGHVWTTPDKFDVKVKQTGIRQIDARQQFTLKSVTNGVATIEMETQVLTPINDPSIEAQLIQRLTAGTLKFDIDAGRVMSQQLDLDRRVIGFNGPASSMHYLTRVEEKLLPAAAKTAQKPVAKKK